MAMYQLNYGFQGPSEGVSSSSIPVVNEIQQKEEADEPSSSSSNKNLLPQKRKPEKTPAQWFEEEESRMTKVYVTNLPTDITEEEFVTLMQKCGLVMKDEKNNFKIKLYEDQNGMKKGDALCTYIKIESVDLALTILDGYEVKPGHVITVEKAKFQLKGQYDPSKKPRQKKKKDKLKMKEKQDKLFEWRPERIRGAEERPKHERVVIVSNAFTPTDFDHEVAAILEFQEDFREEAGKCGNCKKVVIYDRNPEGIVQIFMSTPEEADQVVMLFNGRFFGGRKIIAELYDGKTKYKIDETEEEKNARLENWEKFIATGEDSKNQTQTEIQQNNGNNSSQDSST